MNKIITEHNGAMTLQEFCNWSGLRRPAVSTEIAVGNLQTVKSGRTRLVLYGDAVNWYLVRRTMVADEPSVLSSQSSIAGDDRSATAAS